VPKGGTRQDELDRWDETGTEDRVFPSGGHAAVAIYTGMGKSFEFLRRINIRLYSLANFIRPLDT